MYTCTNNLLIIAEWESDIYSWIEEGLNEIVMCLCNTLYSYRCAVFNIYYLVP